MNNKIEHLKIPPHSIEAEQSLIGGLMLDSEAWDKISGIISENDLYTLHHRTLFYALQELTLKDQPCDIITITEHLNGQSKLEDAGGFEYIASLANNTPSAANIIAYAKIVREKSVLRQLIGVGTNISNLGFQPAGRSSNVLLDEAEKAVFQISEQVHKNTQGFKSLKSYLPDVMDRIETLFDADNPITGISTGFTDFDSKTSGLQAGDLIIIAGRPSMGKTTFAMNIAEHAAYTEKVSVGVFSMEMPGEQLVLRLLSSLGRIDQHKIRIGKLEDDDWPRLASTVTLLNNTKLYIDDSPALSPMEIRSRARRLKREHDLGLIIIDYLQLMQSSHMGDNRTAEVSEISRSLKSLAKELNIPVICLSQLNRNLENRPDKRPIMSDLRESGAIEQDADIIIFIYRDEVYNKESEDKGKAEIIIAKQRNGPIGTVNLAFLGQFTRFENFASDYDASYA